MPLSMVKHQPKIKLKAPTISVTDVDGSTTSCSVDVNEDLRDFLMGNKVDLEAGYYKKMCVVETGEIQLEEKSNWYKKCKNCKIQ